VFHYLGPSLAVLLFAHVHVLGVAWLRIASAALVFALWRCPWRIQCVMTASQLRVLLALGVVLAAMNSLFYLAVDRLPLSTVGAIEFLGTVILAAAAARSRRNLFALVLAVGGVAVLTDVRLAGQELGFIFAFANCVGFMLYVVLGHRIAHTGEVLGRLGGIDRLGGAMLVAAVVAIRAISIHPSPLAAVGRRRRCLLVGDPLRDRSTSHGSASPRHVRAHARAVAGGCHSHWPGRPRSGPHATGSTRHRSGHRGRGPLRRRRRQACFSQPTGRQQHLSTGKLNALHDARRIKAERVPAVVAAVLDGLAVDARGRLEERLRVRG
jgi:hypothetical protein